jgi:CRISPR-associated protein Cmr2
MPRYLITLSLGPVQTLIEAARRTRDLWCGSWLLSEAARAAARVLHEASPGGLIFPCPDDPATELRPQQAPGDSANIANILRAVVDAADEAAIRALCERAKAAASARLADLGEAARSDLKAGLRTDLWAAQIGDLLETYAAWTLIPETLDSYALASDRLGATMAARKATRDFAPARPLASPGLPKSSLDGAFETVLPEHWHETHRARRQLGLSRGEQLDALGVIKRLAGDPEQFTAYSRIAADPWIRTLSGGEQQALCVDYERLVPGLATRVRGNQGIYAALPYDAQLLYDFRLDNALTAKGEDAPDETERAALRALRSILKGLAKERGTPVPYAVILKADGDRMGALLSQARTAAQSRDISCALHKFASGVRGVVRDHHGHAIYAGGDDVLALLPLPDGLPCAQVLADAFRDTLAPVARALDLKTEDAPTLSVGLGIGHLMEPLGRLRARAAEAERRAKGDEEKTPRNALAIILGVRSGAEIAWRANWTDQTALDALQTFTAAYRDRRLPSRVAYDLRATDRRLAWLRDGDPQARGMREAEVARILDRARTEGGFEPLDATTRSLILKRAKAEPLDILADTLILARWLSARTAADLGERA